MISHMFHMSPREVDEMDAAEFRQARAYVDKLLRGSDGR